MTDKIGQRVQRYLLDGSNEDLQRLLAVSELIPKLARTALRRSGIRVGWRVIDCGCGPVTSEEMAHGWPKGAVPAFPRHISGAV